MKKLRFFVFVTIMTLGLTNVFAVPQQINYQGSLTSPAGAPLDTTVSMTFKLYTDSTAGTLLWTEARPSITVTSGLFNVRLGQLTALTNTMLNNAQVWLGITIGADAELVPRSRLVSVGYSYRVGTVDGASGGTITGDVNITGKANIGSGNVNSGLFAFVAGGSDTADGFAAAVSGGYTNVASSTYATVGGGHDNTAGAIGSTISGGSTNTAAGENSFVGGGFSNNSTEFFATICGGSNNAASGYTATIGGGLNNNASGDWAMVGGGANHIVSGVQAVVGGGQGNGASGDLSSISGGYDNGASGAAATIGGGQHNRARGDYSFVGGGGGLSHADSNSARGQASIIGGGEGNNAAGDFSTIGGGQQNEATTIWSFVGGGFNNLANDSAVTIAGGRNNGSSGRYSTIGGGDDNAANGSWATVSGGFDNSASSSYSTVPGGYNNVTGGNYSFAAGRYARSTNTGSFVWSSGGDTTLSWGSNTFTARAPGGFRMYTDASTVTMGASLPANQSAWVAVCDSTKKIRYGRMDTKDVLDKLSRIPIETWSYKSDPIHVKHAGPMAQDFYAAFGLGESDTTISTLDPDGIALAAIQELAKENSKQDEEIRELRAQVQSLLADKQQSLTASRKGE